MHPHTTSLNPQAYVTASEEVSNLLEYYHDQICMCESIMNNVLHEVHNETLKDATWQISKAKNMLEKAINDINEYLTERANVIGTM